MRVLLAVAFVAATLVAAHAIDPNRWAVVAALCCFVVSQFVHVYAHELGHLGAAAVLRFRVVEVAVLAPPRRHGWRVAGVAVRLGLFGRVSRVGARLPADKRAQPARWVLFALSGPLANLGLAAATYLLLDGRLLPGDARLARSCLVAAVLPGLYVGLVNLVPLRGRDGQPSDGLRIVRWRAHPRALPAQPAAPAAVPTGLAELRARVDAGGPEAAALAPALLAASLRNGEPAPDYDRLLATARLPSTSAQMASFITAWVAELQALQLAMDTRKAGREHIDHAAVEPIAEIAEYAYARAPERVEARVSLALVRVFQDRPADARKLLVGVDDPATRPRARVNAYAVRAIAEVELGDVAQARRLIDAASHLDATSTLLPLAVAVVERAERTAPAPQ